MNFRYSARGRAGRIEKGVIDAPNAAIALTRLRARELTPIDLAQKTDAGTSGANLSDAAARDLCQSLSQLLDTGISLPEALQFVADDLQGGDAPAAARVMYEAAARGEAPSSALAGFKGAQARLLAGVLRAGEASGRLSEALAVAAASFARNAELKSRIGAAAIYPLFVVAATCATLACFVLVVVPSMMSAFSGAEDRLPASTRALLDTSLWLKAHGLEALLAISCLIAAIYVLPGPRQVFVRLADLVATSSLGLGIVTRLEYAAFAALSSLALRAGVPGAQAFEVASAALSSPSIKHHLDAAATDIRAGVAPSHAFAQHGAGPRAFLQLVRVGEQSGRLGDTLQQASQLLAHEAEQRLARLGAIAGPIVTLVLGALVASVVLALFLGLLAMSEAAL